MATIIKIVGVDNRKTYALVHVVLDDGTEATIINGGDCEVYFHKGQVRAWVKKVKD